MKTVEEVISNWSKEEKEKFKVLIEESKEREKKIGQYSEEIRQSISNLDNELTKLIVSLVELRLQGEKLLDSNLDLLLRSSGSIPSA